MAAKSKLLGNTPLQDGLKAAAEIHSRKLDGLAMFRPTKQQEPVLRCTAHKQLITGGNRCLPGDQVIQDAVSGVSRRLDQIGDNSFWVFGRSPFDGSVDKFVSSPPFIKGKGKFSEWRLSNGEKFRATEDHRVLTDVFGWRSLHEAFRDGMSLVSADGSRVGIIKRKQSDVIEPIWDITVANAANYLLSGVFHHNSGKTVLSAVRMASFLRNMPVTMLDGSQVEFRTPREKKSHVSGWVIGLDWTHLTDTIEKKLFWPGLFSIIRDKDTKEWRCVDPENPYDQEHKDNWRDAPPLIPKWEIEEYSWRTMKCYMEMTNNRGNLHGYPSSGNLKQGDAVHQIWVDENIENPEYFADWQQRLASTEGTIFWSAYPEMGANFAFSNLYDECLGQLESPEPSAVLFTLKQRDNPHISKKGYEIAMSGLSEEEKATRDEGKHHFDKILKYPWYNEKQHVINDKTPSSAVVDALRANGMRPPLDWAKYLVLDPGTNHPAMLAVAVTPPNLGNYVVPFQEIYPGRMDSFGLAKLAKTKLQDYWFEAHIVDGHAARQTPLGFTQTVMDRYSEAFRRYGLLSRQTGDGFWYGSDNKLSRTQALTSMLMPDGAAGLPRLMIIERNCPQLMAQIKRCRRKVDRVTKVVLEDDAERQTIDLLICLEYFAAKDPAWSPQPELPPNASPVHSQILAYIKKLEDEKNAAGGVFRCGPGAVS